MEKTIIYQKMLLMIVFMLSAGADIFAQENQSKAELKAGIVFAPQASWDFEHTPEQINTPLFLAMTLSHKQWSFTTFYNTSNNSQGLFINYQINESLGVYNVVTKSYKNSGGYLSFGLGTPLGIGTGFFEVGSDYSNQETFRPTAYFGFFLALTKILKKW